MHEPSQRQTGTFTLALCLAALTMFFVGAGRAQQYSFVNITAGLGDLNVNSVTQEPAGYLWVGTENGLYRYDGSQFQQFGASAGIRGRNIVSLFVGPDGTLFVGTSAGLYVRHKDGVFSEIRPPNAHRPFSFEIGTVFTADAQNHVAVADRRGVFQLQRSGSDNWVAQPLSLGADPIVSVQYGPHGGLWFGCGEDLCSSLDGKITHHAMALHLPVDRWLHLLWTRDGHLWIRGQKHLGEVIPEQNRYEPHELPGVPNQVPYAGLAEDPQGRVIAPQGPVLGIWQNDRWRMITDRNGLSKDDISALFVDREGSIWLGVVGHGLSHWLGEDRWEAYTTRDGLSDNIVWSILRDRLGRLWIGTESGLDWMPQGGGGAQEWKRPGVVTARSVALAESPDGAIWVGSAAGALTRIDVRTLAPRTWKTPEIFRMIVDRDARLWVATAHGLYAVDTTSPSSAPRLVQDAAFLNPTQRFTGLTLDSNGFLWTACDAGLFRLSNGHWKHVEADLSGAKPDYLAADKQAHVWVAGDFPGLIRLQIDGDRIVQSQRFGQPTLLSDQVVSLLVDHRGWLWAGQDAGLTVFDGHAWRSFTQDDGLVWDDLDGDALAEDTDGSLWIGTSGGLAHMMHPETLPPQLLPAPAILQMQYGSVDLANAASVPWTPSPLSITLAPLSFSGAHSFHFRYRLLGLESDWVDTAEDTVRYPRLEPGTYRFEAMTTDVQGGKPASPVRTITFTVTPRWWQSWELRGIAALLVIVGIVLVWKWRTRILFRQTRQLETAVRQRTASLEREKTQLMQTREQMRHYAEHDDLTGLWNHRIIVDRLRGEVNRSRRDKMPLSIILVDLDHFKQVNDTHGHIAGDIVLRHIGAVFQRMVRSYDWVGRYGGEEFLLILPGTSFVNARLRAEQLRLAVQSARITDEDRTIHITASFGVASGNSSDFESLIRAADAALYRAKDNGRNCVVATEIEP